MMNIIENKNREFKELNVLPVITWRWVNANSKNVKLPVLPKIKYNNCADEIGDLDKIISEFDKVEGGLSKEILELNDEERNLTLLYHTKENEKLPLKEYIFKLGKENPQLMDAHYFLAEKNSEINVLLEYRDEGIYNTLTNSVIRILAKEGSTVNLYITRLQTEGSINLSSILTHTEKDASINITTIDLGLSDLTTSYIVNLVGEGSSSDYSGIYFCDNNDIDISYIMNHRGENTESQLSINGAMKNYSKKMWKGTIDFKSGCVGSKGEEEEYVILMDDTVHTLAVPTLLCTEENVEGAHAASAGKFEDNLLFYLESRGFDPIESKKMIVKSRFTPTINRMPSEEKQREIMNIVNNELII